MLIYVLKTRSFINIKTATKIYDSETGKYNPAQLCIPPERLHIPFRTIQTTAGTMGQSNRKKQRTHRAQKNINFTCLHQ